MMSNDNYLQECKSLLDTMTRENHHRVFDYYMCELEYDFLGFLDVYKDIPNKIPKDFTIIDIGSYQAVQGQYFKDFYKYIAVEPSVPKEYIAKYDNSISYNSSGQEFIGILMPNLIKDNIIDLYKTFCICSYVPDESLRKTWIPNNFPYYRCVYCEEKDENLPEYFGKLIQKVR